MPDDGKRKHNYPKTRRKPGTGASGSASLGNGIANPGSNPDEKIRLAGRRISERFGNRTANASAGSNDLDASGTGTGNLDAGSVSAGSASGTNIEAEKENQDGQGFAVIQAEGLSAKPKRKYSKRQTARATATSDDANLTAAVLLGVLDTAAQSIAGKDAGLTLSERQLIEDPLARIMERLSPEMSERIQTFSDPILLAFGLGLWGMRVVKVRSAEIEKRQPKPAEPVTENKPDPKIENPVEAPAEFQSLKPRDLGMGSSI